MHGATITIIIVIVFDGFMTDCLEIVCYIPMWMKLREEQSEVWGNYFEFTWRFCLRFSSLPFLLSVATRVAIKRESVVFNETSFERKILRSYSPDCEYPGSDDSWEKETQHTQNVQNCHIITLSYYHIITMPYYHINILPHYHIITMSYYHINISPHYHTLTLSH